MVWAHANFEMGTVMRRARLKFRRPATPQILDGIGRRIARYLEASGGGLVEDEFVEIGI